jgi:hypothetical protein
MNLLDLLHIGITAQKKESNRRFEKIYGKFREEKRKGTSLD